MKIHRTACHQIPLGVRAFGAGFMFPCAYSTKGERGHEGRMGNLEHG